MSTVKVIVPCYKYAHFLRQSVGSVLTQSGVDVRVLILDDASPDNTPEAAAELMAADSRVEYHRNSTNLGHIATYNVGLDWAADGDYTVLLSADDLLAAGALARAVRLLEAHPELGFAYGGAVAFTHEVPAAQLRSPVDGGRQRIWEGLDWLRTACNAGHIYIRSPEVVVRTSLQRQLGGYRAELPHTGDIEMWMRFAAHAGVGELLDADQALYRIHSSNMHHQQFGAYIADLRQRKLAYDAVLDVYGRRIPDLPSLRERVYRRLAREALGFAGDAFDRGNERTAIAELVSFAGQTYRRAALTPEYAGLHLRLVFGRRFWPLPRAA